VGGLVQRDDRSLTAGRTEEAVDRGVVGVEEQPRLEAEQVGRPDVDDPAVVFTEDVGAWFRLTPASFRVPVSTVGLDTGDPPRFVAIPADGSEPLKIASITAWEPGRRLAFSDDDTEVEVTFEPVEGDTRVTLVHRRARRAQR
jgi:hypothetical protein